MCKHSAALVLGDHEIDSFPSRRPVENLDPATLNRASDQEIRLPAYHEHAQVLLRYLFLIFLWYLASLTFV